jgi:hypothetical protein
VDRIYLVIFEDGEVRKTSMLQDEDLQSCDDGVLDVIDITNPKDPVNYVNGMWVTVPDAEPYTHPEDFD